MEFNDHEVLVFITMIMLNDKNDESFNYAALTESDEMAIGGHTLCEVRIPNP
jgi:hypothetical protein